MQWIPCTVIKCSRFHAFWRNGSRLYAVESMQRGPMHPDGLQWILGSMAQIIPIECSGLYAAWPKSRLKAVDSMQHDWIQWIICSMAQSIAIECSGFHAASLNAEHSIHCGAMDLVCMQWRPCSEAQCIPIECSGFYAAWPKASRLNAVDSMHCDWM